MESPERCMRCRPRSSIAVCVQLSSVKVNRSHHTPGSFHCGVCKKRMFLADRCSVVVCWPRQPVEGSVRSTFLGAFLLLKLQLWQTEVCSRLRQNLLVGVAYVLVMIGRAGMDSSRSGLLSTLLMTLPLIVVPAVALLRPPGQVGVSTVDLAASEGEADDSLFDGFPELESDSAGAIKTVPSGHSDSPLIGDDDPGSNPEDGIFQELNSPEAESPGNVPPRTQPPGGANKDPFLSEVGPQSTTPMKQRGTRADEALQGSDQKPVEPDAAQVVEQLNAMGALKTMWFEAGDKTPVGLAVFFRGPEELTRFRFEAVGESREACARDVLEQVTRWQQQNPVP